MNQEVANKRIQLPRQTGTERVESREVKVETKPTNGIVIYILPSPFAFALLV